MAIKKSDDTVTESAAPVGVALQFVDELPAPVRGASSGRALSPATIAIIEGLQSHPGKYALIDVRKTCQPSKSLRSAGVLESFRKRPDGAYDRYAAFVGIDNIPEPKPRAAKG